MPFDGIDTVTLKTLQAALDDIDAKWCRLSKRERTPGMMRSYMMCYLSLIFVALARSGIVPKFMWNELNLAFQEANDGLCPDLFTPNQRSPRKKKERNLSRLERVQARAAAILELGYSHENRPQNKLADKIAEKLGEAGFCRPGSRSGLAYSGDAVKKWRIRCMRPRHPAHELYTSFGGKYRTRGVSAPDALAELVKECRHAFGSTKGK